MKQKMLLGFLTVVLLVALVAPALAQSGYLWSRQCDGETRVRGTTVECWPTSPAPTETPPAPTATPSMPTETPTMTITSTATITPTATVPPAPTATPEPGVPMCAHDLSLWHDLYDEVRGCRYDHEHGDDPHAADAVFGPPGAWYDAPGTEIGGPFAMPPEMVGGHNFFKWYVRGGLRPEDNELIGSDGSYLRSFRGQTHVAVGGTGPKKRYHSFSLEVQICRPNPVRNSTPSEQCGILRQAGVFDMRNFWLADRGTGEITRFLLPHQGDGQGIEMDPGNRLHPIGYPPYNRVTWYPLPWTGNFAATATIQIDVQDGWARAQPNEALDDLEMVTYPDAAAQGWNGSLRSLHAVAVEVRYTPNGVYITDQFGNASEQCTALGQSGCGYTMLDGLWGKTDVLRYRVEPEQMVEYDTSPPGERWIALPN